MGTRSFHPNFPLRSIRPFAMLKLLLCLALAISFLPVQVAQAASITSTAAGGPWSAGSTWVGGAVPLSTDAVIIATTSGSSVNLDAAKVISGSLTINAGAGLNTANFGLTLGGDFINNGTFTAGSSAITLSGTANQNISGFITSGTLSMTKTGGVATLTGNVNAGALTLNGTGGTLNLGAGLTHTFSGAWTRTAGTLDGASSTLNLGGALSGTGGTFTAGTSTVNYTAAGAQTVAAVTYNHLTLGGSGAKTLTGLTSVNGNLSLGGTATAATAANLVIGGNLLIGDGTALSVGGYSLTVTGSTSITGTLMYTSGTGTKTYNGPVTINTGGAWINSGNAAITFHGGLTYNGTTFTSGTAVYTFNTNSQAIGGSSALSITSLTVTGVSLTNTGTLTVGSALSGTGTLVQGTNAVLNIGKASTITGLTASAVPNTVSYTRAGNQTVKATTYYNLTATGIGTKTLGGNLTVNANLSVGAGSTFTVGAYSITVTGTTSVTGTLRHSSTTGTKIYNGMVTINPGGIWNNSGGSAITFHGGLTYNGATFTSGSGVNTFNTNNQTIGGSSAFSITSLTVTGVSLTNTDTLTVGSALSGTGTLVQAANAVLNIGNASTISSLTASANPNTVNYTRSGTQTVKPAAYYHLTLSGSGAKTLTGLTTVNGNLTLSGTASATTAANLSIGGNLALGSGTTLTVAGYDITVAGTTTVSGTLNHNNAAGTKTYAGAVIINSGHVWNNSGNAAVTFRAGLTHNGTTFTAGSGVYTFDTNSQTIGGSGVLSIPSLTVNGISLTNTGTLTVGSALSGTGTLVQGTNATLNLGNTSAIAGLVATASPNIVNYTLAGGQTVHGGGYYHLSLGGSGTKTLGGNTVVSGNLTIGPGTTLDVSPSNFALSVSGNWLNNGAFVPDAGAVTLQGSVQQSLGVASPTTFNDLTINNPGGVTLSNSVTVNGVLTLGSGNLTTNANLLSIGSGGSVSGASAAGYIVGTLQKNLATGAQAFSFNIGDAASYTPLDVAFDNVSAAGSLTATTTASDHPALPTSSLDATKDVNRYWSLVPAGGLAFNSYTATAHFAAGDVDGAATPDSFIMQVYSGGTWSSPSLGTLTATSLQAAGITGLGDLAVGEVRLATTITADCLPNPMTVFSSTTCTATITRAVDNSNTPTGSIAWSTDGSGSFSPANSCTLSGFVEYATCSVTYTSSIAGSGSHQITAAYSGDAIFSPGTGSQVLTVARAVSTVSITGGSISYQGSPYAASGFAYGLGGLADVLSPAVSFTYTGTGSTVYGPSATAPANAGTYLAQAAFPGNGNYLPASASAAINIDAIAITVTAASDTRSYDGTTGSSLAPTITFGALAATDSAVWSQTFDTPDVGGSKTLTPAGSINDGNGGANYIVTFVNDTTGVINPRAITVTADAGQSKLYADVDPTLTYTVTGGSLAGSDALSGSLLRAAGEDVGSYAISQGSLAASPNYALSFTGDNFTITPQPITITADAGQNKTYADTDPALTYTITSGALAGSDSLTGGLLREAGESVGSYAITQGTLAAGSNYALTYVGDNFSIAPRAVTVTADAGQGKGYADADPLFTYSVTSGSLAGGDTFGGALAREAGEDVGSYAITQGSLTAGGNYALTYVGDNFSITPRSLTLSADAGQGKVYAEPDPVLTYTLTAGSLASGDSLDGAPVRVAGEDAGSYAITRGSLSAPADYTLIFIPANFTISPRPITVTAAADTKTYDGSAASTGLPGISAGSLASGDTASWTQAFDSPAAGSDKTLTPAGTVADGNGGANYAVNFVADTNGIIEPRTIAVSADAQGITYGDADPLLSYTHEALLGADSFSGALSREPGSDVGSYAIRQGSLTAGPNYNLAFTGANLTIGQKTIQVAAVAQTKTYGTADPLLSYTSDSLVGTDAFSGSLLRASGEDVGSYAITQGSLGLNANYDLHFTGASLSITARTINVAADPQSKIYGQPDPALTYTADALAGSDGFSGALSRQAGTAVGSYAIGQGSLGLSANYDLHFTGADLGITPAALTVSGITAADKTYDGGTAAVLDTGSAALAGVLGGDDVTLDTSAALGAFSDKNAGSGKTVSISGLALGGASAGNYVVTTPTSSAAITKATLTVTASDQSIHSGDPDPSFTFSYGGFVGGDDGSAIDSAPACAIVGAHSAAGTYPITCSGAADNNYDFNYARGTLTVNAVNALPTDITLSAASVGERLPAGTLVGAFTTSDTDAGASFEYSLVNGGDGCFGADNASFRIDAANLLTNASFDYRLKSSYVICVETNDGRGGRFQKQFVINVIRAPLSQQDGIGVQLGNWKELADPAAYGGSYRAAITGSLKFSLGGTKFNALKVLLYRGPNQGKLRILVDGVNLKTVDLYNATPEWNYQVSITGLRNLAHTVTIQPLNQKNRASSGTQVRVDGFVVNAVSYDDNGGSISMVDNWTLKQGAGANGGSYRVAGVRTSVFYTFSGTQTAWITARGPAFGLAAVYVDGRLMQNLSLYNRVQQWNYAVHISGLSDGPHTLEVRVLGARGKGSIGADVVLDAFGLP